MSGMTNAQRLRQWLLGCGAIDDGWEFGVDWLGDSPTACALITAPSALRWGENILGQRRPERVQAQDFLFAVRAEAGPGESQRGPAVCGEVAAWIRERNARREFPLWEGGAVTGVTPTQAAAPVDFTAGTAVWRVPIRVTYETE